MLLSSVGLVAVGLLLAADAGEEATKKDLAALQGDWKLVKLDLDGEVRPDAQVQVTFDGDKVKTEQNGEKKEAGTIRLDAGVKPKIMDFKPLEGDELEGIYEVEGDKLTIALVKKGAARPVDFKTLASGIVATFERVK